MKRILSAVILLIAAVSCSVLDNGSNSVNSGQNQTGNTVKAAPAGFVYAQGTQFMIDGKPFYFAGCNAYSIFTVGEDWMTNSTNDIENYAIGKTNIDTFMSNMAVIGVKVLRTWGFDHQAWMGYEPANGVYNEAQFMKFDYILQSAQKYGIKVIIVLENYWADYGGIDAVLQWFGLPSGDYASRVAFFTNASCIQSYKNYVQHWLTRLNHYTLKTYSADPAIFSWELMNKPRGPNGDSTGTILRAWVDQMGSYIKSLDPNHMVSAGLEGHGTKYGFGGDEGNPFVYIHQSPYIDFCTAHPYPDESWANLTTNQAAALVDAWIADAHGVVGKPFVMEEFNTHNNKQAYWTAMYTEIENKNAAGDCFWNFNLSSTSDFDMLPGDAVLTGVFMPHAAKMASKSGPVGSSSSAVSSVAVSSSRSSTVSSAAVSSSLSSAASSTAVSSSRSSAASSTAASSSRSSAASSVAVSSSRSSVASSVAVSSVASSVAVSSAASSVSGGYAVNYTVNNDWGAGATCTVTIKNNSATALSSWSLVWTFAGNQAITQIWSASQTTSGEIVTAVNLSYNGTIGANGGTQSFGFNLSYSGSNAKPTSFTLNGTACTLY